MEAMENLEAQPPRTPRRMGAERIDSGDGELGKALPGRPGMISMMRAVPQGERRGVIPSLISHGKEARLSV
ncbi:hypothetical protein IMZ11_34400 [Microtetraspora sp. AC03309]|uniref:hypothetical protein n=1 Tax=Microtetraspora sp. AC03309 TaxID=2779376 RepID=UPI001E2E3C25|nr:hypothetical protein [Microtetraspora sp. AC03309]MCC5580721.1 hypothetical protein [Microtetraspora sp. AC03309]